MLARVKKNDTVLILSEKVNVKIRQLIFVYPKDDAVLVKDVNVVTRHIKQTQKGKKSGIVKEERPVPLAKVMPVCSACKKPCRIQSKTLDEKNKVKICNRFKE